MGRATGDDINRAFKLQDKGLSGTKICSEMKNTNIRTYIRLRPTLEAGILPEVNKAYSLAACKEWIDKYGEKNQEKKQEERQNRRRIKYKVEVIVWEYDGGEWDDVK